MTSNGNSLDQRTFGKLSRLYIIALSTIALSVLVSQFFVRQHLETQQSDSTVINVAGRQRMLSQKLTKEILLLTATKNNEEQAVIKETLKETLSLWQASHYALQHGDTDLGLPSNNSTEISNKFKDLNIVFDDIKAATERILNDIEHVGVTTSSKFKDDVSLVLANEKGFLFIMDQIVNQYNVEADDKVSWLGTLESLLTILTLCILLAELVFIFLPAAKSVRATLAELLQAEKHAKKMAYDADVLSVAKEKSIKELRALTQAMDETLLFARILSSGQIIHIGNKFSRRFKFSRFNETAMFWSVMSAVESEQVVLENLVTKYKKIGWQGEVKATTKAGEHVWLEMAIIPFSPNDEKTELLIIASEITERKAGELEIQRLTKKTFLEEISQQKIISSKIIENQEKEQNRIAKDVHDGIGQMLTGLKYNLESININDIEKTASKIEHLKVLTTDIIKGVRTATFNLTPPELSDHGIVPAIIKLTKELGRLTGKDIVFFNKTDFNERLDSLVEINIYRIVQEAINNAIKYADSTHILVSLSHSEKILSIVIDDDGKGFNPDKVKNVKNADGGMGMTFMKERIKYIDGRLFLSSEEGKGTRLTLNIPLKAV